MSQVRSEAAGLWWPVKADSEEESQDDEEAGAEDGVHCVQVEEPGRSIISPSVGDSLSLGADQENQALWAGRRKEAQGSDDPVLTPGLRDKKGCPEIKVIKQCFNFAM